MAAAGAALIALAAGGWITSASQGAPQSGSAAGGVGSLSPSTTTQSTLTGLPGVEGFAPFQEASQLLGSVGLFGASVAVSADGRTAIVGAPREGGGAGSARVFVLTPSGWQEQAQLGPSEGGEGAAVPCTEGEECRLGVSVAISADGNTVIAGSPREEDLKGAVRAFVRTGTTWSQLGPELTGESSRGRALFGRSVAISADGQTALIGAPGSATATILHRSGSGWTQEGATIASPDKPHAGGFGSTVALSGDGSVAFIGAPGVESRSGAVWAFVREGNDWRQQGEALTGGSEATAGAHFGSGLALSFDGSTALVGADGDSEGAGAAWALVRSGATWIHQGPKLTASGELGAAHFGQSVALSASGDSALAGGPADNDRRGAAWTLTRADSKWSQQAKIPTPDLSGASRFGTSVSLSADGLTALIGAPYEHKLSGSAWALWTPASPTVQTVEPSEGPSSGGTDVTITGSGFLPGASVRIGTAAASVEVTSETTITAVTAKTTPGSYEVQVSDADGTSTGGPSFTYSAPAPEKLSETTDSGAPVPKVGLLAEHASAPPAPVLAARGNLDPVSGQVRLRLPGSHQFVDLTGLTQIPFGTVVDATNGTVSVTTADGAGGTQTMTFSLGEFLLTQSDSGRAVATLEGGNESVCRVTPGDRRRAETSTAKKHVVRKLWADGHGNFSTQGHYASGAVLGTRWLTEDLCGATLIRVFTDEVAVTDFVKHRRVIVKAGHSYLARAR